MSRGRRIGSVPAVVAADVVSTLGTEMAAVALPWFVLVTTGSPSRMAGVMAAEFAGMGLFGVPAGHVAHVLGPRRALVLGDALRAVLVLLIPVLHWTGYLHYGVIVAVGVAVGAVFPSYTSAQRLVVAGVVGDDELRLTRVGGLLSAANESASFVGPAIGGVLVAAVGAPMVLVVDAATFVLSLALLLAGVRRPATPPDERREPVTAGLRELWRDRPLRRQVAAVTIGELAWTAMVAVLPVAARRHYSGGAALAGAFLAAYGGGSVVGGLISSRTRTAGGRVARASMLGMALVAWGLVTTPPPALVIAAIAVFGLCNGLYFPRLFAAMTLRPQAALRGPVMTAATTTMSASGPFGFVIAGLLLDHHPVRTALWFVAAASSLTALVSVTGEPLTAGVDVESRPADEADEREATLVSELHGE